MLFRMLETFRLLDVMVPWFFPTFVFVVGACVGSFLNVCIYRIPAGISVVTPRSRCACGNPIPWYDNLPILSWILLRGKARCCGRRFGIRYPVVEALTGILFWAAWTAHPPVVAVAGMVLIGILIAASFIDLDHMIIPDRFTIGGFLVGLCLASLIPSLHLSPYELLGWGVVDGFRSLLQALQGAFLGSAILLWIGLLAEAVLRREAMGFGDVKLMGAIGAFLGWEGAVFAIFGGAIAGCMLFAVGSLTRGVAGQTAATPAEPEVGASENQQLNLAQQTEAMPPDDDAPRPGEIPFGPSLAIGAVVYFLWGHVWFDAYIMLIRDLFQ